ncbi:ABC transporter permease [Solimonas sp. K1W22B-7]|uniref:ABC transporter permease n=1 Tax=Solimonas sp. K1W22B-7 TaxID=2303331 RepID=UPI000E32F5ED|nr:ABC transporter permease [Solimonas sp. K1W22B-7]AXQ29246.1 ABC transporter permease [Solimonas sp. K1W22B-7]
MKRLLAMIRARLLEVVRDRSALAWNLLFAPLLVVGMAVVFSGSPPPLFKVGVLGESPLTAQTHPFLATEATQFYREPDLEKAVVKLQRHRIDLLLDPSARPLRYWVNTESAKGRLLQSMLKGGDPDARAQPVTGTSIRYSDWLVPGLLGLNIMFSSLFAIGHVIVRYRKSGYLKRLNGTPLRAVEFISAQLIACLLLIVGIAAGMYAATDLFLHLRMEGSYFNLLLVAVLGSMSMIAMSLLISARIASEELSGGLLNLLSWPMVVLSGVFFSLDGAPAVVQAAAQALPLTHMLEAARAVMIDGAGLADIARPLLALAAMTALFLAIGAGFFRWSQD